ncbi:MAG: hypothetical protein ACFE0R_13740 [Salinarimonas sp.]
MAEHDPPCPLAALCAEAGELIARKEHVEARALSATDPSERHAADRALDELSLSLDTLAQRASDFRPRSRQGSWRRSTSRRSPPPTRGGGCGGICMG